jgi:hypothetical protein
MSGSMVEKSAKQKKSRMKSSFQKLPEMSVMADESVDFGIAAGLRLQEIDVFSIAEEYQGEKDIEVLK